MDCSKMLNDNSKRPAFVNLTPLYTVTNLKINKIVMSI